MKTLESRIKQHAHTLGFELVGIAPATPADGFGRMREWLDQGYAGEMGYMHRQAEARRNPSSILSEVRSVVMVGMNYKPAASGQWPVALGDRQTRIQGDKEKETANRSVSPCLPVS